MDTVKFVVNNSEIMSLKLKSGFDMQIGDDVCVHGDGYIVIRILREGYVHTVELMNKDTYDRLELVGENECIIPKSEYENLIAQVEELKEKLKKGMNVNINFESVNIRSQDDMNELANKITTLMRHDLGLL